MGVPAHRVRMRQPAQEGSQVAVALRPEYKVPVIGHQDISEDSDGATPL